MRNLFGLLFLLFLLSCSSCSTSRIMKNCENMGQGIYKCEEI